VCGNIKETVQKRQETVSKYRRREGGKERRREGAGNDAAGLCLTTLGYPCQEDEVTRLRNKVDLMLQTQPSHV